MTSTLLTELRDRVQAATLITQATRVEARLRRSAAGQQRNYYPGALAAGATLDPRYRSYIEAADCIAALLTALAEQEVRV